jgi:DNA-binding transcriptional LysR family regulator
MELNLHLLRIFLAVVDTQSFTRAATRLHISQPAVSKAVKQLQQNLQLPLLEQGGRGAKGIQLTESGRALHEHARGIFALERAAIEDVRARVGLARGQLSIGASTTVASYWLPGYLAEFRRRHPGADIRLQVANTQRISEALIECRVDVALVEGEVSDPRISSAPWRDEELCVLSHPEAPVARKSRPSLRDLDAQVWLVREPGSGTREVGDRLRATYGWVPAQTIEIGSNEGIARTLAEGLGVAMLPERVVRELLALNALVALRPARMAPLHRPLYRMSLRERPESPLVAAFGAILDTPLEAA